MALAVSHKFYICAFYSLISKYFCISLLIPFLIHEIFGSVNEFSNIWRFRDIFLFLISNLILLWLENIFCNPRDSLNLWRLAYGSECGSS